MLLTVVICVYIDFCIIYGTKIGERCETIRTWFDSGESTNYTDYTENKIRALRVIRWQNKKNP